eukprot:799697-Prorocentrum_minimum.AAC.1
MEAAEIVETAWGGVKGVGVTDIADKPPVNLHHFDRELSVETADCSRRRMAAPPPTVLAPTVLAPTVLAPT